VIAHKLLSFFKKENYDKKMFSIYLKQNLVKKRQTILKITIQKKKLFIDVLIAK